MIWPPLTGYEPGDMGQRSRIATGASFQRRELQLAGEDFITTICAATDLREVDDQALFPIQHRKETMQ